jgi:putative lipoprotein
MLGMVSVDDEVTSPARTISGIQWAVTEVMGAPWENDNPATLIIDDKMNFSIFGGCNRFSGQLILLDGEIAFPQSFAGTLLACSDETEALERGFLNALARVSGYVRYGAGLVMTDLRGNALLHLEERPQ